MGKPTELTTCLAPLAYIGGDFEDCLLVLGDQPKSALTLLYRTCRGEHGNRGAEGQNPDRLGVVYRDGASQTAIAPYQIDLAKAAIASPEQVSLVFWRR